MKMTRHIVCTEHRPSVGHGSIEAVWPLSDEVDWIESTGSFDLLGATSLFEQIPVNDGVDQYPVGGTLGRPDNDMKEKVSQLLHAMWLVFDEEPKTIDQGVRWLGAEVVTRCLIVAEVFALLEKKKPVVFDTEILWQHSLRTGYLSGVLAKEEHGDSTLIVQSCLAGFSHDIGLAILAVLLDSSRYLDVMACARKRCLPLANAELLVLGISHEIVGAEYLQRQRFPKEIVNAVSFHDEPLACDSSGLTPTIAVYAANLLDGGGWPQDSDGVPSERSRQYLATHGFVDPWPKWRRCVERLHRQDFRRV